MSASAILYLVGMAALFAGEHLAEGTASLRWIFDAGGILLLGGGMALRAVSLRDAKDPGLEKGHRTALALATVGAGALLLYVLSTEAATEFLNLTGEAARRWSGSWSVLWPVVWLCGSLPLLVVDVALRNSPVVMPPRRIDRSLQYGLAAALGVALVFPVNYLASRHKVEWNLSHFQTARPGSSTRALVDSLDKTVHVYAFFPPTSDVRGRVESYFAPLEGSTLQFEVLDQTAHPRIARELEVRENGRIAFTTRDIKARETAHTTEESPNGDGERSVVETLQIPTDSREAESKLETLDQRVRKRLTQVSQGERVAYLTTGHGEFSTDRGAPRERRLRGFKKILEASGFKVETSGLGQGLAEGVPEDADLVAIVGPTDGFLKAEVDALEKYLDRGGALLVALEPAYARRDKTTLHEDDPLRNFLDRFGTRLGDGVLVSKRSIVPIKHNKTDRLNLVTNRLSSHASTATLANAQIPLFMPTAGYLTTSESPDLNRTVTVRSPAHSWVDRNGNLAFDAKSGEQKKSRPIVAAVKPDSKTDTPNWRAVVAADATMFSDLALGNRGNQQFLFDKAQWLVGTPELTGSVNTEEDVRIRHTKEGQAIWFYGTVLGVPLLLFAAGAFRIWRRRGGGEEE